MRAPNDATRKLMEGALAPSRSSKDVTDSILRGGNDYSEAAQKTTKCALEAWQMDH